MGTLDWKISRVCASYVSNFYFLSDRNFDFLNDKMTKTTLEKQKNALAVTPPPPSPLPPSFPPS